MKTAPSRRKFLAASAAVGAATLHAGAFAAANDRTLRIGLVGCGGRGTGAAVNALQSDPNLKLTAMCDVFMDRLQDSLTALKKKKNVAEKLDVTPDRCFDGFEGFDKLLKSDVDVVLLCTPPGFRPMQLRAAIEAGKHVFCEKPVAVDAAGVRSVIESARLAKEKSLSLCSGFCYRYDAGKRETVKRIHDGLIGDVAAIHSTFLTGALWHRGENPKWSPMEYQLRNWYYFTWLSGDFIVEQHCHNIDKARWVLNGAVPESAVSLGGRQVRTDSKWGHIFDHFATVYEFSGGRKVFSFCRQIPGCQTDVNDHVMGTKGQAQLMRHTITPTGGNPWTYEAESKSMYDVEHDELIAGIRSGKIINDGESAAMSTLMAIMGRNAAYSGKKITWKEMLASKEDLVPKTFAWGDHNVPGVPVPGVTKFI